MKAKPPSKAIVASELGAAQEVWDAILAALANQRGAIGAEWRPSKSDFGWMCLLRHKERTLLYLTPERGAIRVAIVLGERAVELALASGIPEAIKTLIRDARPYAEGRGIRFSVASIGDVALVADLVAIKATPR